MTIVVGYIPSPQGLAAVDAAIEEARASRVPARRRQLRCPGRLLGAELRRPQGPRRPRRPAHREGHRPRGAADRRGAWPRPRRSSRSPPRSTPTSSSSGSGAARPWARSSPGARPNRCSSTRPARCSRSRPDRTTSGMPGRHVCADASVSRPCALDVARSAPGHAKRFAGTFVTGCTTAVPRRSQYAPVSLPQKAGVDVSGPGRPVHLG